MWHTTATPTTKPDHFKLFDAGRNSSPRRGTAAPKPHTVMGAITRFAAKHMHLAPVNHHSESGPAITRGKTAPRVSLVRSSLLPISYRGPSPRRGGSSLTTFTAAGSAPPPAAAAGADSKSGAPGAADAGSGVAAVAAAAAGTALGPESAVSKLPNGVRCCCTSLPAGVCAVCVGGVATGPQMTGEEALCGSSGSLRGARGAW